MMSGIATPSAKRTNPSSNVPPVESTHSQRWMPFSGDSSSSNVRCCDGEISFTGGVGLTRKSAVTFLSPGPTRSARTLRLMVLMANFRQVHRCLWYLHVHLFHGPGNDLRNSQITEPLVI